jgi:hypothetical protein
LQAVRVQGGAGAVTQLRSDTGELADVRANQANRGEVASAGGGEPSAEDHALFHLQAVGEQGGT